MSKLVSCDLGVPCQGNAGRYVMTMTKSCKARIKHLNSPYVVFASVAHCFGSTVHEHAHVFNMSFGLAR